MKRLVNHKAIMLVFFPVLILFASQCASANETWKERWKRKRLERQQLQSEGTSEKRDFSFIIRHGGKDREYGVHLPSGYDAKGKKTPVVIYLHGGGGNIRSAYQDRLNQTADQFGFILTIPLATRVKWGLAGKLWNGGKWKGGQCCGEADDVGFISKVINELKHKYNVDERRIYATGISNGGLMTNRLACELTDKLAAIATVAPAAVPGNCRPSRPIPVMNIHGTGDLCNPYDGSRPKGICKDSPYERMSPQEVVDTWLEVNGCSDKSKVSYAKGKATCRTYSCKAGAELEFCRVEGMGHTWPSGSQYISERAVGPVSYDITSEQIWDFFKRHKRP